MEQPSTNKVVVLPPPVLSVSPLTNKYDLIFDLSWGTFKTEIKVNRELGSFNHNLITALNEALLNGSESKPYLLQ